MTTAAAAVQVVKSNDRVFLHSAAANPRHLVEALVARARSGEALSDVELCHLHLEGGCAYASDPALAPNFHGVNFFVGANQRQAVADGRSDFVPIFLSEVALLFRRGLMPLDVAFLSVSPPDRHDYCSLGPSVDISLDAMTAAKVVIAQVNKYMPRTHGDGIVHVSRFNYLVEHDEPLPEAGAREHTPETNAIGRHVAALVEDGSTLQMGIGAIPDAVLSMLTDRKDLGIHTEMFSEGVIELVRKGVISNRHKAIMPYHIVGSFLTGSRTLFDFVDDNPLVHLAPSHYVNDPSIIKRNPKVVAINSALVSKKTHGGWARRRAGLEGGLRRAMSTNGLALEFSTRLRSPMRPPQPRLCFGAALIGTLRFSLPPHLLRQSSQPPTNHLVPTPSCVSHVGSLVPAPVHAGGRLDGPDLRRLDWSQHLFWNRRPDGLYPRRSPQRRRQGR